MSSPGSIFRTISVCNLNAFYRCFGSEVKLDRLDPSCSTVKTLANWLCRIFALLWPSNFMESLSSASINSGKTLDFVISVSLTKDHNLFGVRGASCAISWSSFAWRTRVSRYPKPKDKEIAFLVFAIIGMSSLPFQCGTPVDLFATKLSLILCILFLKANHHTLAERYLFSVMNLFDQSFLCLKSLLCCNNI